jgi:hypothetical protein
VADNQENRNQGVIYKGVLIMFSFCEPVTASSRSFWHIRKLSEAGRKLGGGADTPSLCGRVVCWDLEASVEKLANNPDTIFICPRCLEAYKKETQQ